MIVYLLKVCVSPIKIPNPNYGATSELMRKIKDCESRWMYVPCNVCAECVAAKQQQIVQRCRSLAIDHYIFFLTLTYNNDSLPYVDTSTGFRIPYADIADLQKMFKRIRKADSIKRPFLYFAVTERGSKKGRPHIHCLLFIRRYKDDDSLYPAQIEPKLWNLFKSEWKRNYGSSRNPIWRPLFTFAQSYSHGVRYRNYDCHYVTSHTSENGSDDVAFYVSKYVMKSSNKELRLQQALKMNLPEDEFEDVWKIVKSKTLFSKKFGAATEKEISHIKYGIKLSSTDNDGLKYYSANGQSFPLARYYRKFVSAEDGLRSIESMGGPIKYDDRSTSEKLQSISKGIVIKSKVDKRDLSELFPI